MFTNEINKLNERDRDELETFVNVVILYSLVNRVTILGAIKECREKLEEADSIISNMPEEKLEPLTESEETHIDAYTASLALGEIISIYKKKECSDTEFIKAIKHVIIQL